MNSTEKAPSLTPIRRWVTYLGIFLLVQVILILVDGTSLEPNINDSDSFIPKTFRSILDSSLFTEWITPYSYPFFNMVMTVHIIALLIVAITEIVGRLIFKK
ncbi:YfzA family protein [Terribacillus saccharophilus]|uniref:YfzA family protein n=1 Tax=Terribacillus saccharophilus TaxID=361277 RepID=UPI002DD07EE9|nr:YfzA family protein [Terribacillus saccharophilus]